MFRFAIYLAFSLGLFVHSAFAVDLRVQGAANAAVNGKYIPNGTMPDGSPFWKHESATYYIYYDEINGVYNWNIDDNTNDETVLYYSNDNPDDTSPSLASEWLDGQTLQVTSGLSVSEILAVLAPEIALTGNNYGIADENATASVRDHTVFGSADVSGGTAFRTFTIRNTGTENLDISSVTFQGGEAGDFSVTSAPAAMVSAGGQTSFTVTFNPSGAGVRSTTIHISNSDSDESPYNFAIQGYGYTAANIQVSGISDPTLANGAYVHQGVLNGFEYWKHETESYYVMQSVTTTFISHWLITDKVSGSYSDCLWSKGSTGYTPVGLTGWTASSASYTGTPVVATVASTPDMVVVGGNNANILDNDASPRIWDGTHFGSLSVATGNRSRSFTIQNIGGASLDLTPAPFLINLTGAAAGDFTVTAQPSSPLGVNGTTMFTVQFDPTATGTRTAMVSIASNDPNENPYNFTIVGEGTSSRSLFVSGITAPIQANGRYVAQGFNSEFQYWKHESANYYLYNAEYSLNRYWFIDDDLLSTTYTFRSNTETENAYPIGVSSWFASSGNGGSVSIQFAEPEIALTGNTLNILDGDIVPSASDLSHFGDVNITESVLARTFTIQNLGTDPLSLTGTPVVTIQGSGDFTVTSQPAATLNPNATTTFTIQFNPSILGAQTALVNIANTDTDENPFDFVIEGVGVHTPALVSSNTVTEVGKFTAKFTGSITAIGSYGASQHGFCWNTTGNPTIADDCSEQGVTSTLSNFEYSVSGLLSGKSYYVRAYATSDAGTSYGTVLSFTTTALMLNASVANLDFTKDASVANESVTANVDWIAESNSTWLTVEPAVGSGNGPLVIRATKNSTLAARSGQITISSAGLSDQTILVNQAAGDPMLALNENALAFSKITENQNVDVTSNTSWSASTNQTWVILTPTTQIGSGILKISVSANSTILTRQAIVTVKVAGLSDQEIAITQAAGDPTLALSKITLNFANGAGQNSFDVTSNTSWFITSSATWVTLNSTSGSGSATVALSVTANSTLTTRSATITVRSSGLADKTILIQQAAANPPSNRAPVLVSVKTGLSTDEDKAFTLSLAHVVATDEDDDGLSLIVAAGSHYSVKGLVVTPETNFFGTLSIPVTVNDGELSSNSKTLTLEVKSVNDLPVVRDTLVKTNTAFTLDLSKLATDVEGSVASVQLVRTAKRGTTVLTGASVKYTPNKDFVGKDTLTWIAVDKDKGKSDTALLAIQINAIVPILENTVRNLASLRIVGQNNSELNVQWSIPNGVFGELSLERIDGSRIVLENGLGNGALQQRSILNPSLDVGIHYLVLRVGSHVRSRIPFTWR